MLKWYVQHTLQVVCIPHALNKEKPHTTNTHIPIVFLKEVLNRITCKQCQYKNISNAK